MAFKTDKNATETNNNGGIPDHKKAVGFINFYLPNKGTNSGRTKLGAIPLRELNDREANLAKWLAEDPERIKTLLSKLEIDFNLAEPSAAADFDLS